MDLRCGLHKQEMAKHQLHHHHRRQADMDDSHAAFNALEERKPGTTIATKVATLVSVVYVTASPTFTGSVAGYTTIAPPETTPKAAPSATPTTDSLAEQISSALMASTAATTIVPSASASDTATAILGKPIVATSSPVSADSSVATDASTATAAAATSTVTESAVASQSSSSSGMSGGAIAGIVIGILLAIIALLAVAGLLYRRKKFQESEAYHQAEDEKQNPFADVAAVPPMSARVPPPQSLHLRPTSNFDAEISGAMNDSRAVDLEKAQTPVEPLTTPFAQPAELPQSNHQEIPAPLWIATPTAEDAALAAGAGMMGGAAATTVTQRHNALKPLEIKRASSTTPQPFLGGAMPSPAGTEFSMTSMTPSTVAGGPAGPTNVHRIQLDFKPSMDDELELRAGQLVRLLHEYDDGWVSRLKFVSQRAQLTKSQALCIRLDRSAQGVAPRTCLSARPVKPRSKPPGPPPPGMRVPVQRSMSPGPYGGGPQPANNAPAGERPRANSANNLGEPRNSTPLGPSPLNTSVAQMTPPSIPASDAAQISTPTTPRSSHGVQRKPVPGSTPTPST